MTYRQIADMITSIGVPASYYQFADDTGQEPPFICYYFDSSSALTIRYSRRTRGSLSSYTQTTKTLHLSRRSRTC